ncbi:MAG: hypothetical protein AAF809_04700 [Bacteroidota bacterium]
MSYAASYRSSPRLAEVTRHFRGLQGLRILPMALFFLVIGLPGALQAIGFLVEDGSWETAFGTATLVGLAAAVFAERRIARWYDEAYGIVEQRLRLGEVLASGVFLVALLAAVWWLGFGDPPLNPVFVVLGVGLLAYWRPRVGLRLHYAIEGGLLLAASLYVPASSSASAVVVLPTTFVAGLLLLALGVLDHRELVRTLGPPEPDADHAIPESADA